MFAFREEIIALAKKDPSASKGEKRRVVRALSGAENEFCVRFSDAAARLGITKRAVFALVADGVLEAVALPGKRNMGVTPQSLASLIAKSRVAKPK